MVNVSIHKIAHIHVKDMNTWTAHPLSHKNMYFKHTDDFHKASIPIWIGNILVVNKYFTPVTLLIDLILS